MTNHELELKTWMLAGLDGDAVAHARLLAALVPILRSFYRRRFIGGDDDIEDLVQETIIAVHNRRATFERGRPFTAWMFAIARYKMVDEIRRGARLRPLEDAAGEIAAPASDEQTLAEIDVEALLATLPSKQAQLIRATKLRGLSVAEAATCEGVSESDVKVSVHRGLKALAARVQGFAR